MVTISQSGDSTSSLKNMKARMMVGFKTAVSFVFLLGHAAVPTLGGGSNSKPSSSTSKLSCYDPSKAPSTCQYQDHACDQVNRTTYWTVHSITPSIPCIEKCVSGFDMDFMLANGFRCGRCFKCIEEHRCDKDGKGKRYNVFRMDKNKCESTCAEEGKLHKMLKEQGYNCGTCQTKQEKTKTGTDSAATEKSSSRPAVATGCILGEDGGFHCGDVMARDVLVQDVPPPTPTKCILKRALQLLKYEPNYPALDKNVYVQVLVAKSGNIYNFTDFDHSVPEFYITNNETFHDMRWGDSFQLRFVSPRGPGGWNTCRYSPIALDLDRDGYVNRIDGDFIIDITGDGDLEDLNEWFGPREGILINTKNKGQKIINGIVSGQHLFGDMGGAFSDGFEKLALLDNNGDGFLRGSELKGLALWVDRNSNTKIDNGELSSLGDHSIVSLKVTHESYRSTATLKNGSTMLMEDLWFSR